MRMVLARVIYELFETEAGTADIADRGEPVYLGRQLRLELAKAPSVYIAWTWGALPDSEYHMGWSHQSFCKGATEVEYDATHTPTWAGLAGHALSLHFRDPERQVLEVRTHDGVVFCCSFERSWHADTLYVARCLPEGAGGPAAA
jgi:hypothetical protein